MRYFWKQEKSTAAFVVQSARVALDQYKFAKSRKGESLLSNTKDDKVYEHWTAIAENQIKVHVAGAIFEQEGTFDIDYLDRGHNGQLAVKSIYYL